MFPWIFFESPPEGSCFFSVSLLLRFSVSPINLFLSLVSSVRPSKVLDKGEHLRVACQQNAQNTHSNFEAPPLNVEPSATSVLPHDLLAAYESHTKVDKSILP